MKDKIKALFIVPMPPPVTGQSLISQIIYSRYKDKFQVRLLNYARASSLSSSNIFNIAQILKTFKIIFSILTDKKEVSLVYMNVSVSFLGNLKDILFLKALGKLRKKTIAHVHSGGLAEYYKKSSSVIKSINRHLLNDVHKIIVLSDCIKDSLTGIIDQEKVTVIKNFYEPDLVIDEFHFNRKWDNPEKISLLFFSNMIKAKGYNELLNAFLSLDDKIKNKCMLFFAGKFDSGKNKAVFLKAIKKNDNICYADNAYQDIKKKIMNGAHALFLPSRMTEGQPLVILEAYASGCAVFAADAGGIKDIFNEPDNGRFIRDDYERSLKGIIAEFVNNFNEYKKTAENNLKCSAEYTKEKFLTNFDSLIGVSVRQ